MIMATIKDLLTRWRRNKAGEVMLTTSEEAVFYGTVISDKPKHIKEVEQLLKKARFDVGYRSKQKSVNLDLLFALAVKGQFYRECLDEVARWKDRDLDLDKGVK